ncbi:type I restriction endonuclease [Anaerosinus sp.]
MDLIDQLKQFSSRIEKMKEKITTEEATKTAMILPFFQMLGYDVFNPLEFVPEYTADVGIKKGEKVDYAIMDEDDNPLILIEAKWCGENLDKHGSQLFRYFSTTSAKFGILTNGIIYQFFTDLDEQNKMDEKPFLEFNLLDIKEMLVPELKKFQKANFDIDTIFTSASELKYSSQIKQLLSQQLVDPTEDFIRCIINDIYDGMKTQNVIDKFRGIIKKSLNQFINEQINDRLKTALGSDVTGQEAATQTVEIDDDSENDAEEVSRIITTEEEIESFCIVKTLLRDCIGENTISYKDTESYFSVLLNNNIRKWICRLQISEQRIALILPDENKKKIKYQLDSLDDLFEYKENLLTVANRYLNVTE